MAETKQYCKAVILQLKNGPHQKNIVSLVTKLGSQIDPDFKLKQGKLASISLERLIDMYQLNFSTYIPYPSLYLKHKPSSQRWRNGRICLYSFGSWCRHLKKVTMLRLYLYLNYSITSAELRSNLGQEALLMFLLKNTTEYLGWDNSVVSKCPLQDILYSSSGIKCYQQLLLLLYQPKCFH